MSYRQSLYPGASTNSLNTSTTPSPSAINSLLDKQRQVEHFHQILKHSQNLLELYKGYSDKYHVLVGGSEGKPTTFLSDLRNQTRVLIQLTLSPLDSTRSVAVGDVVEHWQNVFRSTSLALGKCISLTKFCTGKTLILLLYVFVFPGSIHSQKQQVLAEQGLEQQDLENVELGKNARPDQLVRLPVDQTN